ncbi:MAG: hypothetical protein R6X33_06485 [Candidatus Brocadiia bacterium]
MADRKETQANVVRREGRTWIEDVPRRQIGDRWDMLLRGVRVLLEHRGEGVRFHDLMALSGDAFNLCFTSHWQGTAYLAVPTDTLGNVTDAYGYEHWWNAPLQDREMRGLTESARRELTESSLKQIREEIDAGRPVLVGGCADRGCAPWSAVVGYDDAGEQLCHVGIGEPYRWTGIRGLTIDNEEESQTVGYWNGRVRGTVRPNFVGGWLANPAFMLGDRHGRPSRRANAVSALSRAVDLFEAEPHEIDHWGGVTYWFGEDAYREWAGALEALDYPADLQKPRPNGAYDWYEMHIVNVMVDTVVRGRTAAAEFCNRAGMLLGNVRHHMDAAARSYRREVALARDAFSVFLDGDEDEVEAWLADTDRRALGAAAVRRMLERERAAVRAVQEALQVERQEVPAASVRPTPGMEETARSREGLGEDEEAR